MGYVTQAFKNIYKLDYYFSIYTRKHLFLPQFLAEDYRVTLFGLCIFQVNTTMEQKELRKFMGEKHYSPESNAQPGSPPQKEGWFVNRRHSADSIGYDRRGSLVDEGQVATPVMNSVLQANLQATTTPETITNSKNVFRSFDFK